MAFDTLHAAALAAVNQMAAQLNQLKGENTRLRNRIAAIEEATPACSPGGTGVLSPERMAETTTIDKMCAILKDQQIKASERTDCVCHHKDCAGNGETHAWFCAAAGVNTPDGEQR